MSEKNNKPGHEEQQGSAPVSPTPTDGEAKKPTESKPKKKVSKPKEPEPQTRGLSPDLKDGQIYEIGEWKEGNLSLSCSMLKDWIKVLKGKECGKRFDAKYVRRTLPYEQSAAAQAGCYFEYICTGSKNADGSTPAPVRTKSGIDAVCKRVPKQAEAFADTLEAYGLEIIETGLVAIENRTGYRFKGIYDCLCVATRDIEELGLCAGEEVILDLKFSGLLDDKWSDYGWEVSKLHEKDSMLQVASYKYLDHKVRGTHDIPFLFYVASSKNETDSNLIRVDVNDFYAMIAGFENMLEKDYDLIYVGKEFGFDPLPQKSLCKDCKVECPHHTVVPDLTTISISGIFKH